MKQAKLFLNTIESSMQQSLAEKMIPARSDTMELFSKEFTNVPKLLEDIYTLCDGMTFDFFVGLKLMSSSEVIQAYRSGYHQLKEYGMKIIPFMKDAVGNHMVYAKPRADEEYIAYVKGPKHYIVAHSTDAFWEIAIQLYSQNVYIYRDPYFSIDYEKLSKVFKELTHYD